MSSSWEDAQIVFYYYYLCSGTFWRLISPPRYSKAWMNGYSMSWFTSLADKQKLVSYWMDFDAGLRCHQTLAPATWSSPPQKTNDIFWHPWQRNKHKGTACEEKWLQTCTQADGITTKGRLKAQRQWENEMETSLENLQGRTGPGQRQTEAHKEGWERLVSCITLVMSVKGDGGQPNTLCICCHSLVTIHLKCIGQETTTCLSMKRKIHGKRKRN